MLNGQFHVSLGNVYFVVAAFVVYEQGCVEMLLIIAFESFLTATGKNMVLEKEDHL